MPSIPQSSEQVSFRDKKILFFNGGAKEVWFYQPDGQMAVASTAAAPLSDNAVDDMAHVTGAGKAGVQTLEFDRHASVFNAQELEHGGVEIVDVHRVFHGRVTQLIRRAEYDAWLDPAA